MTRQQKSLCEGNQAKGDAFVQKWMEDLFLFAQLPRDQNLFACGIVHRYPARFGAGKAISGYLAAIDEGESEPVGQYRTQLFHQIQGKAGAARAVAVQESNRGIEAYSLQCRSNVVRQKYIEE